MISGMAESDFREKVIFLVFWNDRQNFTSIATLIGVFAPGFGPKEDLNDPKDARYGYISNADTRVVLPDTVSANSSSLSNLFRNFSLKIP
jgi:hypothetical protein